MSERLAARRLPGSHYDSPCGFGIGPITDPANHAPASANPWHLIGPFLLLAVERASAPPEDGDISLILGSRQYCRQLGR